MIFFKHKHTIKTEHERQYHVYHKTFNEFKNKHNLNTSFNHKYTQ